jgi:hypothetical protein
MAHNHEVIGSNPISRNQIRFLIAQLVEQMTVNHRVLGSSPSQGANNSLLERCISLVERTLHTPQVPRRIG